MKLRHALSLAAVVALALTAQVVMASSGGAHGSGEPHINWWTWDTHAPPVGWFLVDFVIFVALLVRFVGRPLAKTFQNRHDTIAKSIAENEAALATTKASFDEARGKLASVEQDVQTLIAKIKEDGAAQRDRIVQTANEYADRLKKDTEQMLVNETNAARDRLRKSVAAHALQLAEQELVQKLTAADQTRMADEAIAELESSATAPQGHKRRTMLAHTETGGVQ